MHQNNMLASGHRWYDSSHASLCVLGNYLQKIRFFEPLERHLHLKQKVLKDTPIQKLEMLFVGFLAGIKAVSHTATTVRVVPTEQLICCRNAQQMPFLLG